jgi:hypothetical protein
LLIATVTLLLLLVSLYLLEMLNVADYQASCACLAIFLLQDPRYMVTFYHNVKTGESTYEKPEACSSWEQQYAAYLMSQQSAN